MAEGSQHFDVGAPRGPCGGDHGVQSSGEVARAERHDAPDLVGHDEDRIAGLRLTRTEATRTTDRLSDGNSPFAPAACTSSCAPLPAVGSGASRMTAPSAANHRPLCSCADVLASWCSGCINQAMALRPRPDLEAAIRSRLARVAVGPSTVRGTPRGPHRLRAASWGNFLCVRSEHATARRLSGPSIAKRFGCRRLCQHEADDGAWHGSFSISTCAIASTAHTFGQRTAWATSSRSAKCLSTPSRPRNSVVRTKAPRCRRGRVLDV